MAAAHGAAGQPPQAPQAPAFTPYPDTKLSPCVRLVAYTMDNTCGTNKSQFMFGALATAPLRGYVDAIKIEFMVVGHTKMRLDNAFSATGNAFRKNDVFNLGMLCNLFSPYFDVRAYDERLLKSYRSGTPAIFTDIKGITGWRSFMLVGDDGLLNLTTSPDGTIAHAVLMKAVGDLEERSLAVVLEAVVEGTGYHGIGDETGLYGPKINRLFPLRRVRLFYRPTEGVGPWCEYSGYQKTTDATAIEAALSCIIPFKDLPENHEAKQKLKAPYGQLRKHLDDQFSKYVPPNRCPDQFKVSETGCSSTIDRAHYTEVITTFDAMDYASDDDDLPLVALRPEERARRADLAASRDPEQPEPPARQPARASTWSREDDDPQLMAALDSKAHSPGELKKRARELERLFPGKNFAQIKRAHDRLVKSRELN